MSFLLQGVKIYNLPQAFSKYIQEKTASSLGTVRLLPFAFPVFVLNPFEYNDSFKGVLQETAQSAPLQTAIDTDPCPEGEIWEVTNIAGTTQVASDLALWAMEGATPAGLIWYTANTKYMNWSGSYLIQEGQSVRLGTLVGSSLFVSIGGKIRYA